VEDVPCADLFLKQQPTLGSWSWREYSGSTDYWL